MTCLRTICIDVRGEFQFSWIFPEQCKAATQQRLVSRCESPMRACHVGVIKPLWFRSPICSTEIRWRTCLFASQWVIDPSRFWIRKVIHQLEWIVTESSHHHKSSGQFLSGPHQPLLPTVFIKNPSSAFSSIGVGVGISENRLMSIVL